MEGPAIILKNAEYRDIRISRISRQGVSGLHRIEGFLELGNRAYKDWSNRSYSSFFVHHVEGIFERSSDHSTFELLNLQQVSCEERDVKRERRYPKEIAGLRVTFAKSAGSGNRISSRLK